MLRNLKIILKIPINFINEKFICLKQKSLDPHVTSFFIIKASFKIKGILKEENQWLIQ